MLRGNVNLDAEDRIVPTGIDGGDYSLNSPDVGRLRRGRDGCLTDIVSIRTARHEHPAHQQQKQ